MKELVICKCASLEHQIIFSTEEDWEEVFINIHLTKLSFWQRIIYGIKYIFGYQCQYGAFDEIIIGKKDVESFKKIVNHLLK